MFLLKSHIRATTRHLASGAVVSVKEHEDNRELSHRLPNGKTEINHAEYQKKVKGMSDSALRHTIKDCQEAIKAMPDGHKSGYYADEIHYCAMELKRRQDKS